MISNIEQKKMVVEVPEHLQDNKSALKIIEKIRNGGKISRKHAKGQRLIFGCRGIGAERLLFTIQQEKIIILEFLENHQYHLARSLKEPKFVEQSLKKANLLQTNEINSD